MNLPFVRSTSIPGLMLVDLPVHADSRGWFKENWQREKMVGAGLPDFRPIQNNVSFNKEAGTTRGIHAEPWDKYVSVVGGSVFGVWVDLREGPDFGRSFTATIGPGLAVFVPRGVGNGFQTLEPDTGYSYLVTEHWSQRAVEKYTFVNLADTALGISWPIPLELSITSEADKNHPPLAEVKPMKRRRTLVVGGTGQVGRALSELFAAAGGYDFPARTEFDFCNPRHIAGINWSDYDTVINAAAYTQVDLAETGLGRVEAWDANVGAVAALARICIEHGIILVHISSDYVFDGSKPLYGENEQVCPLGVYGQTKAAGDALVQLVPKHYIVRTSWVTGEGANFVETMKRLASAGIDPSVVNDQIGRLTFTDDIAAGIAHLLETEAPYGTYNLTGDGEPVSWARIAQEVFSHTGHDPARVKGISTAEYFAGRDNNAPRPCNSILDLGKIQSTGFPTSDHLERLKHYLETR